MTARMVREFGHFVNGVFPKSLLADEIFILKRSSVRGRTTWLSPRGSAPARTLIFLARKPRGSLPVPRYRHLPVLRNWGGALLQKKRRIANMKFDHRRTLSRAFFWLVFLTGFGIVGRAAFAQSVVPASAAERSQPRKGDVDIERSRVYTFVGKTGFGHEHGVVGRLKGGSIRLGAKENAGQLEFDLASFQADTKEARHYVRLSGESDPKTRAEVTANMLGKYVLDVEHYPTATFVIDSAIPLRKEKPNSPRRVQLDGQFTLHGTTRPLRVIAVALPESGGVRLRGFFHLLQTDYKITPFSKAFGAVGVTDKLRVYGDILLVAADK
jgi:polyisoprenoid-binding protein YceI